jgi:hypothetical protein
MPPSQLSCRCAPQMSQPSDEERSSRTQMVPNAAPRSPHPCLGCLSRFSTRQPCVESEHAADRCPPPATAWRPPRSSCPYREPGLVLPVRVYGRRARGTWSPGSAGAWPAACSRGRRLSTPTPSSGDASGGEDPPVEVDAVPCPGASAPWRPPDA